MGDDIAATASGQLSYFGGLGPRAKRLLSMYSLGVGAYAIGRRRLDSHRAKSAYIVTVRGDDDIFPEIHRWLLAQLPDDAQRSLIAETKIVDHSSATPVDIDEAPVPTTLKTFYDGSRSQDIVIDGHKVQVSAGTESDGTNFTVGERSASSYEQFARARRRVQFSAQSRAGRDAVLQMLDGLARQRAVAERRPRIRVCNKWGSWNPMREAPPRQLDTVCLAPGQRDRIVADVARFLASESGYARLGIPWHHGLMFHGPPGTGKSSLVKALAGHFKLDLYYLPLSDVYEDGVLLEAVGNIAPRSILLIEDIDASTVSLDRDTHSQEAGSMSLSALLNALDGATTPHGLITIITTNHPDRLDTALLRPGRIDLSERLGLIEDPEHFAEMVAVFTGIRPVVTELASVVSPADLVAVAKRNMHAPDKGFAEMTHLTVRRAVA